MHCEDLMPTYAAPDIVFDHGQGSLLYATDGRCYLDFSGGIAVNTFGHVHPYLLNALQQQATRLWHTSNAFRVTGAERLAGRLVEASFADRVFFANSGTEAVECGLKILRHYHYALGAPRTEIVGFEGAFHGRTIAALGAAGNAQHMSGFVGPDDGFTQLPFGDIGALERHLNEQIAGVIVEPIQGEGGIRCADVAFLSALRNLCSKHDIPLMFDEVQTGMGRTGHLFAYQYFDVVPDLMALAKGLGGGFPVGACLATEALAGSMVVGTHGSTFGGNPLAMAVANAVMDLLLEEGRLKTVSSLAALLWDGLAALVSEYPGLFSEVRGVGLMLGLKCVPDNGELLAGLREHGLLLVKAGENVLRLLPALNVTPAEIGQALEILHGVARSRGCK